MDNQPIRPALGNHESDTAETGHGLSVLPSGDGDAIEIANGTVYGLVGYVWSGDIARARRVGARLRAGRIYLNNAPHGKAQDVEAPFGGYKQSGNGLECGVFGFEEYLEVKAVIGYDAV